MIIDSPISLAQKLIQYPSITPNPAGVMDEVERVLSSLGFVCFREIFSASGTDDVENLYARFGDGEPNFCFAGHLDVVPVGDVAEWSVAPFAGEIRNGRLYGRGAEDMKGAIACFITAVSKFIVEQGDKFSGSISLLLTMDEEGVAINGTKKMLQWLKECGQKLDICLVGEPTNPNKLGEMIKIGRRGSMNCKLKIFGKQGHVAYPNLSCNPARQIVNILYRLQNEEIDTGTEYFQPSNLEVTSIDVGNDAHNVIPSIAKAMFNVRFNDSRPVSEIKNWIQYICEDEAQQFDLEMVVTGEAFHTEPGHLTHILQQVVEQITGLSPELSTSGGTSDARFIKDYCPVVEFGTTGSTAHQIDENVSLQVLERLHRIYYHLLCQYFARG